jgi:hypothetical protein
MEVKPTEARAKEDLELNNAFEAHATEELDALSIRSERMERIDEYEESALSRSDPLAAVIGIGNVTFQRSFEEYGAAILDEINRGAHTLEALRELEQDIRLLVKMRNCIEKDIDVQSRLAGQEEAAISQKTASKSLSGKLAMGHRDLLPKRWP